MSSSRAPRVVVACLTLASVALCAPRAVHALTWSCGAYRGEEFEIRIESMRSLGKDASVARRLVPFNRIRALSPSGRVVYLGYAFWTTPPAKRGLGPLRFALVGSITPSPEVSARIARLSRLRQRTTCGSTVPYVSLNPGIYRLRKRASKGAMPRLELPRLTLIVPANRQQIVLRFERRGRRYEALYRVAKDLTQRVTVLSHTAIRALHCVLGNNDICLNRLRRKRRYGLRRSPSLGPVLRR